MSLLRFVPAIALLIVASFGPIPAEAQRGKAKSTTTTRSWKTQKASGKTRTIRDGDGNVLSRTRISKPSRSPNGRRGLSERTTETAAGKTTERHYQNSRGEDVFETVDPTGETTRETWIGRTVTQVETILANGNLVRTRFRVKPRTRVELATPTLAKAAKDQTLIVDLGSNRIVIKAKSSAETIRRQLTRAAN